MWFMPDALLLKDKIDLYNNIASSGECTGRLSSDFVINPSPQITWEFETIGESACDPISNDRMLIAGLVGNWFTISEAYVTTGIVGAFQGDRYLRGGVSPKAYLGNTDNRYEFFGFYLPNTRVLELCLQQQSEDKKAGDFTQGEAYRTIEVRLDKVWSVRLRTEDNALQWLGSRSESTGTLLTTIGELYTNSDSPSRQAINSPDGITVDQANEKLKSLALLLSFANSGYTSPLYVQGDSFDQELKSTGMILSKRITPIEKTRNSWVVHDSDLENYLGCYAALERMLRSTIWQYAFPTILMWYFQAVHPEERHVLGRPWPVIANALGAALELLSYTILVLEEHSLSKTQYKKLNAKNRLECMLQKIGIPDDRWPPDYVWAKTFVDLRNDATHPEQENSWTPERRDHILRQATLWVEEILLWRLGYSGNYTKRAEGWRESTERRYDLALRNPNW